ncbi:hypothetical protein Nepgr_012753 [Nepenthes gracilis]|uniref:Uncharacterized protein n=1 Tax=Nepenthes gracilis TaxID=150966 RepID=A0AAD3SGN7_NEPGR|nr:hypothetical protein Nepgr_012753 [Nepenthes gracilis]
MVMSSHPHGSNCNGTTINNYQPSPISLAPLSFPPSHHCPSATDHAVSQAFLINVGHPAGGRNVPPTLGSVRLSDLSQYNGASSGVYSNAVEGLSG